MHAYRHGGGEGHAEKKSEKGLTAAEKEDMIFYNQRTGNPYKGDKHAGQVYERLSNNAKAQSFRIAVN